MAVNRSPHEHALPNYEDAVISRHKLERYCLDPEHLSSAFGKSSGKDKARVFQAALGFEKSDWELLKIRILEELPYQEAVLGHEDEHGTRYNVRVPITGPNGQTAMVLTAWIIRPGTEHPFWSQRAVWEESKAMPFISGKQKAYEGDVVELSTDLPQYNSKRGDRGVVIAAFAEPSEAYDLELASESDDFLGLAYSIKPDQFSNLSREAFVRAMQAVERADLTAAEKELRIATNLRPDYIGAYVMSVIATVPDPIERKGFEEDVSFLIPLLRLATHIDPTYEFASFNLAVAFLNFGVAKARKKEYLAAIELFYSALGIRTDSRTEFQIKTNIVMAFTSLARESFDNERIEEGFGYVRSAFLVLQDDTTRRNLGLAYGKLGVFLMRSERFDFAMEQFERAEDLGVILPAYLNDRGVCLVFLGRLKEAAGVFARVLEIDPQDDIAHYNLAKLEQAWTREGLTPELDAFADQFFMPEENLADFEGHVVAELTWRRPAISTQEFVFA